MFSCQVSIVEPAGTRTRTTLLKVFRSRHFPQQNQRWTLPISEWGYQLEVAMNEGRTTVFSSRICLIVR
jgi:hypothetical protein